jgi:urease accessory protein
LSGTPIDWLDLTWHDCTRRALRTQTRAGRQVKLLLPVGQALHHGDILFRDHVSTIAINLVPTKVLVATTPEIIKIGRLALELGNLHVPVQITDNEVITLPDGPAEAILERLKVPFNLDIRRFVPERCTVLSMPVRSDDFAVKINRGGQPTIPGEVNEDEMPANTRPWPDKSGAARARPAAHRKADDSASETHTPQRLRNQAR